MELVAVGGRGIAGFNGGAAPKSNTGGGGGASHIAIYDGILQNLVGQQDGVLLVAGGGGGVYGYGKCREVRHGGGYVGSTGVGYRTSDTCTGGTQTAGGVSNRRSGASGSFGLGGTDSRAYSSGGGGGWYGGAAGYSYSSSSATGSTDYYTACGGGGSGYFATSISNGCMYSYNTTFTSNETATKTVSTSNVSETPTSGYAKQGNGYARITLIE